jgi:hypothetical protein
VKSRSLKLIVGVLALAGVIAPLTSSSPAGGQEATAATEAARWRNVHLQGFEGAFPAGLWNVRDQNDTGVLWDDNASDPLVGGWSAHPADSAAVPNGTQTWMRYGPFSLVGATNARVLFDYELTSEPEYDFLRWGYSCTGERGPWYEVARSGNLTHRTATIAMRSCRGKANVFVRWIFESDRSNESDGAWVDNIRIQKFS